MLFLLAIFCGILIEGRIKFFLQMAQQIGYIPKEYLHWIFKNKERAFGFFKKNDDIVPLVMTDRAKRLYITCLIIPFVFLLIPVLIYAFLPYDILYLVLFALILIFEACAIYWNFSFIMFLALIFNSPIEKRINMGFYNAARDKIKNLKSNKLKVISITGSYGKTSTKTILYNILKTKFRVFASPESYNTPMGLSKIINNDLDETYDIFVAELGARYVGEILEVAELTSPDYGVITNIGPCHLETFKSLDNIVNTKFELSQIPGIKMFLNIDNDNINKENIKRNLNSITVSSKFSEADYKAEVVKVDDSGTEFVLSYKNNKFLFNTSLIGSHNITNICLAIAISFDFGMTYDEIKSAVASLPQIEHRLSISKNDAGVTIIDDGFNSNPYGARAALEVLSLFSGGKKIVITPGMVELGNIQYEENYEFGKLIGNTADISVIVGSINKDSLIKGINSSENKNHINYYANTLKEATQLFPEFLKPGDVMLFENDLTDVY